MCEPGGEVDTGEEDEREGHILKKQLSNYGDCPNWLNPLSILGSCGALVRVNATKQREMS